MNETNEPVRPYQLTVGEIVTMPDGDYRFEKLLDAEYTDQSKRRGLFMSIKPYKSMIVYSGYNNDIYRKGSVK